MKVLSSIYSEPHAWVQDKYVFRHSSGYEVWTRNGFWYYAPYPGGIWPLRMKWRFRRALLWWHKNRPIAELER